MGILDFVFGIIVLSVLVSAGLVGLVIWGITKIVRSLTHRLSGKTGEETPRMPKHAGADERPRPETEQRAAERRAATVRAEYTYLDVDAGTTAQDIISAMENYQADAVVGGYAHDTIDALDAVAFRRRSLLSEIDSKFQRGSISWDRFYGTALSALDAIVRNCALLANRVQAFDSTDYLRISRYYQTGGMHDASRLQRWKMLEDSKSEMENLRSVNEGLLLELGKLSAELGKIGRSESQDENSRVAEEIRRLVNETKFYR